MVEEHADDSVSQRSILETTDGNGAVIDADASTTTGLNPVEERHADYRRRASANTLPKEVVVSSPTLDSQRSYVFEVTGDLEELEPDEDGGNARDEVIDRGDRVRVEGVVGTGDDRFAFSGDLIEVDISAEVQLEIRDRDHRERKQGRGDWRKRYRKCAREYVPAFYEAVPTKKNLHRCVKYVARTTSFWETLGEKMSLDRAVVTAAYAYPAPNDRRVETEAWDGILGDMYADMPEKYRKQRNYPIAVPVVVVYLYDEYINAVAYLRPYGSAYESYGYAIRSGHYQRKTYGSKSDYESNTWWWTEDGWGDAGDTEGGILEGVPIGLVD